MKNKDKGKLCVLMVATMILNASFNMPKEATHHTITKIDKYIEEPVKENTEKLPNDVVELPNEELMPEPTIIDLENIDIKELYNLDSDTINKYYENYGYEKAIDYICEHYNITFEQFKVLCAIIMAEGNPDVTYEYKENYAVTSIYIIEFTVYHQSILLMLSTIMMVTIFFIKQSVLINLKYIKMAII